VGSAPSAVRYFGEWRDCNDWRLLGYQATQAKGEGRVWVALTLPSFPGFFIVTPRGYRRSSPAARPQAGPAAGLRAPLALFQCSPSAARPSTPALADSWRLSGELP